MILVRVLHRLAHREEQPQTLRYRKRSGIFQQRSAVHILHHEVWQACFGCATVEQTRDVGMLQAGQDLPFRPEAAERGIRIGAPLDQLDGYLHAEIVFAYRAIDGTHASLTDQGVDGVPSDA